MIFEATIKEIDSEYSEMATRMRELGMSDYGCTEFSACTEGSKEIAIFYWPSIELIKAWHQNPEHQKAQALGKSKWYASYKVSVTKIVR